MSTLAHEVATQNTEAPATLRAWNEARASEAAAAILPCNGSHAWAKGMAALRPLLSVDSLAAAADAVWNSLGRDAQQQAFDSHPRIGEPHARAATKASLHWSEGEQSAAGLQGPEDAARAALAIANQTYEERFGRVFIVCATGRSAAEMLAMLKQRLHNDPDTEWQAAAEEQRRITQLRLRKWLGLPPVLTTTSGKEAQ